MVDEVYHWLRHEEDEQEYEGQVEEAADGRLVEDRGGVGFV